MIRKLTACAPTFVSLVCATALSACAVLQIDVDVYKGPLANHEDVQIQQLGAMAIAARPLLVSLRDQLAKQTIAQQKSLLLHAFPLPASDAEEEARRLQKFYNDRCPV